MSDMEPVTLPKPPQAIYFGYRTVVGGKRLLYKVLCHVRRTAGVHTT
jgi:hypothetical protein